jgi:multidrug efflux system membrane fusion protein
VEQIHRLIVKPKFVYACVFAGALMLCGCTGNKSAEAAGNTPGGGGQGGPGSKGGTKGGGFGGPVSVMVAKAVTRDVPIQAEVIGNVEASSAVTLRPQISGQITQAFFTEGEFVNKGKLLLTIDKRALEAQMKQLEAQISKDEAALNQAIANLARDKAQEGNARGQFDRADQLFKQGILSKEQRDQYDATLNGLSATLKADQANIESSKAAIAASQANVENQKVLISYTNIYAPISGRTGTLVVKPGNVVTANTTELATINQVSPIFVTFALPEANLATLRQNAGRKLPVTATAEEGGIHESGTLAFFENAVDPTTGTIKLKATFANTDHALWPGQFVRVTLQLGQHPNAILVPNQAVQSGQDGTFVYAVQPDQRVAVRPVQIAQRVGEETVITSGIQSGETVVTEGTLRLVPGARIQVRQPNGAPAGGGGRRGGGKGGQGGQGGGGGQRPAGAS